MNKRTFCYLIPVLLLLAGLLPADEGRRRDERSDGMAQNAAAQALNQRTFNVLAINKLGQYVSNMGQFYSSWNELSPTAEWPLGSGHEAMWRMNLYIGTPGNVVQTRTFGTKEWDPVDGYQNPEIGLTAVSNDTSTWPRDGEGSPYWPVRDKDGNNLIRSSQDSYAVFRDRTNYLSQQDPSKRLNIEVHQSSYAWNTALDEDYIIFQFELINDTTVAKDSLYFCIYADFDAGGFGDDWVDDKVDLELDRQFTYFYDADNWSVDWETEPFHIGLVFLETPEVGGVRPGITDWHYTDNFNEPRDITNDVEQFQLMSSDPRLRDDPNWPDLFHGDDLHYDDPSLIRATGDTLVTFNSSGPYHMEPFDTLRFVVAMICGQDYEDISANVDRLWEVYNNGYRVKSVPQPRVSGSEADGRAVIRWDNRIDREYVDPNTGTNTLKYYRIYKTEDPQQLSWTLIDSLPRMFSESDPYQENAYQFVDVEVINGFYYSYAVTVFDSSGDESGIARVAENVNTVELRPRSEAQGGTGKIRVVPNPYVISASWERERLGNIADGEPIRELSFINLPANCTIRVFTVDGDLVKTIRHTNGTGTEYWDIRSDFNQMIATGVYFFHVDAPQGEVVGKFAIIR